MFLLTSRNMEEITKEIKSGYYDEIEIVKGCDAICSACPYCKDNRCQKEKDSEERARRQDLELVKRLSIKPGDKFPARELWRKIKWLGHSCFSLKGKTATW